MLKIRVSVTTLVAAILIPVISMAGDVVLIGNPSIPIGVLSKYDIKNIFLGSKLTWKDGSNIFIVIQRKNPCHKIFLKEFIDKTPAQFSNYWKKQIFTGKGIAPPAKKNDEEVIKFVSQTKGSIGYVSTDTGLKNVKIITVK